VSESGSFARLGDKYPDGVAHSALTDLHQRQTSITRVNHINRLGKQIKINCCGRHDRCDQPEFTSQLRSDTLMQYQSDSRHRLRFVPTLNRNDDTNRVDLAARTAWVDVIGAGCDCAKRGSDRSHRSGFAHHAAEFGASDSSHRRLPQI
jgi:hypothetical protein